MARSGNSRLWFSVCSLSPLGGLGHSARRDLPKATSLLEQGTQLRQWAT